MARQARVLAMLFMTLKGTPFFYMGDELGKKRSPVPPDRVHDPFEKLVPGFGLGRDPERTPMRWTDGERGDFTTGEPWLTMQDDGSCNVDRQQKDKKSILQLYRKLIELRRRFPALVKGEYQPVRVRNEVLSYQRALGGEKLRVGLNIANEPRLWEFEGSGVRLISTYLDRPEERLNGPLLLRANEGVVVMQE